MTTISTKQVGSGTLHFPGLLSCPPGDFTYTRQQQVQSANYEVSPTLFDFDTLVYDWLLEDTLLSPAGDKVALLVQSSSPFPLPDGSSSIREVIVMYAINDGSISLQTRPEDANYSVLLRVHAHDDGGRSAWTSVPLDFYGDVIVFEQAYYRQVLACIAHIEAQSKLHRTKPKPIPRGGDPGPYKGVKRKIAETIRDIVRADPRLAGDLSRLFGHIPGVRLGHGLRQTKKAKKAKKATKAKKAKSLRPPQ